MVQTILRRDEVERATGMRRASIYAKVARGEFPKPLRLGPQAVGWLESEVLEWQKARIAERDGAQTAEAA